MSHSCTPDKIEDYSWNRFIQVGSSGLVTKFPDFSIILKKKIPLTFSLTVATLIEDASLLMLW